MLNILVLLVYVQRHLSRSKIIFSPSILLKSIQKKKLGRNDTIIKVKTKVYIKRQQAEATVEVATIIPHTERFTRALASYLSSIYADPFKLTIFSCTYIMCTNHIVT